MLLDEAGVLLFLVFSESILCPSSCIFSEIVIRKLCRLAQEGSEQRSDGMSRGIGGGIEGRKRHAEFPIEVKECVVLAHSKI